LKVNGSGFTRDCSIHLGTAVLTTTFVSAKELTARVSLSTATKGQVYNVTVVPSTNIVSNAVHFTLKNPMPTVMALSPADTTLTFTPFTLTVTGKDFVPGAKIMQGSTLLTTTFVSSTKLMTSAIFANVAFGTEEDVTVINPGPGGGTSNSLSLVLDNPAPVVSSISPSLVLVGSSSTNLFIFGSGFQPDSVLKVGDTVLTPFGNFSGELIVSVPSSMLASPAMLTVSVTTPGPGGGEADGPSLTVGEPSPFLFWVSPTHFYSSASDQTLTLMGASFSPDTVVEWNGTPLTISRSATVVGRNAVQVTVPALLVAAGTATVKVLTPAPGGGSVTAAVVVSLPPPQIGSMSPGFVVPGGGSDLAVTIFGVDFVSGATVSWNGDTLTPDSVTATTIQVTVPAADVADAGVVKVVVVNPDASGSSLPASFAVDTNETAVVSLAQRVNDIDWDATRSVFYGSSLSADATHPHALLTIDPLAAGVTRAVTDFSEPGLLSVGADGDYLYAARGGVEEEWSLPDFTLRQTSSLATITAMRASPQYAHIVAVNTSAAGVEREYLLTDGQGLVNSSLQEPWDALDWGADGTHLYAGDNSRAGGDLVGFNFDLLGALTPVSTPGLWSGTRMHVDMASGLIYADGSTTVIDPAVPEVTSAIYPVSGVMIPDSTLGCAYFITQTTAQVTAGANDYTLSCYSTTDQTLTRSIVIPAVNGMPTKMMRWGNEGLAFITDGGYIYFVSGQIVTGN
jgi:hypothetical protein